MSYDRNKKERSQSSLLLSDVLFPLTCPMKDKTGARLMLSVSEVSIKSLVGGNFPNKSFICSIPDLGCFCTPVIVVQVFKMLYTHGKLGIIT